MSSRGPSSGRSFSPEGHFNRLPPPLVQHHLRSFFSRWGLPQAVRVDNGSPWGSWNDWPTELALWWIGLGVTVIWNPPRRPQANGVVERSQGTGKRWAEPSCCHSPEELQQRPDEAGRHQRESYPYEGERSRWEVYPGLASSGRPYSLAWEEGHWDWGRVREHLAGYAVSRRVDSRGRVTVYEHRHYVGLKYKGQAVWVGYDPDSEEWLIQDEAGTYLGRVAARGLTAERVRGLRVTSPSNPPHPD